MKFSIIIPTYNRKKIVRHAILALINQGIDDYEVIVCDDGSNDGTETMVRELKTPFEIKYKFQEKSGFRAASARNLGIKIAKGKKIFFIDQDVIVSPLSLKKLDEACFENNYICGYKKLVPIEFYNSVINDDIVLNNFLKFEDQHHGKIHSTLSSFGIIYKNKLDIVGGFNENFVGYGYEDVDLMRRLENNNVLGKLIDVFAYHIEHQRETINQKNKKIVSCKIKHKT